MFDDLLSKKVTLESLLQLAQRADYYGNVSAIGAQVIAQSARDKDGKTDVLLKKLRDRIHPLWDSYGRMRNASRSKRNTATEVLALKKELQEEFGDMSDLQRHNFDKQLATSAWLSYQQDVRRTLRHYDMRLSALTDPRLDAPSEHEFESVRRSCANMGSDPIDLLINIKVMLVEWCPFRYCHLYDLVSFEKFTIRSLNRFAAILHEDIVRIMMHKSVCTELLDGELDEETKAVFRRRFVGMLEETIQSIVGNLEAIKEDYWPQEALRLAKKVIGDKDVPIPESDAVERTYRPIAERIKANLSASYPWYSYEVVVFYPHELADDYASWEGNDVAQTRFPHRNVHVAIFRRNKTSSSQLSLTDSEKKDRIAQLFT